MASFRCVFLLLLALALPAIAEPGNQTAQIAETIPAAQADIQVFVRSGCPHCAEAEQFLAALQKEQPNLRIEIHNIGEDQDAYQRLKSLAETTGQTAVRVPAFWIGGEMIVGYSEQATDILIRQAIAKIPHLNQEAGDMAGSCEAEESLSCEAPNAEKLPPEPEHFEVTLFGQRIGLEQVGLPAFTLAMGLLDGFNPCSMWVLILMISMLAPMKNRLRMLAVAGAFVAVEGIAYFVFMAAWLNLFLLVGLSRISTVIIAIIAILAGAVNLKDFWAFGVGFSLSIPASAKPGIYARMRGILQAENLLGAMIAAVILAVLVQIVELMCTSGFPALYTRILTLRHLDSIGYYGYILLYNAAYMLDDVIVLLIGVYTLSQQRLQEKEGRRLKLLSGLVMVGLGIYLLIAET